MNQKQSFKGSRNTSKLVSSLLFATAVLGGITVTQINFNPVTAHAATNVSVSASNDSAADSGSSEVNDSSATSQNIASATSASEDSRVSSAVPASTEVTNTVTQNPRVQSESGSEKLSEASNSKISSGTPAISITDGQKAEVANIESKYATTKNTSVDSLDTTQKVALVLMTPEATDLTRIETYSDATGESILDMSTSVGGDEGEQVAALNAQGISEYYVQKLSALIFIKGDEIVLGNTDTLSSYTAYDEAKNTGIVRSIAALFGEYGGTAAYNQQIMNLVAGQSNAEGYVVDLSYAADNYGRATTEYQAAYNYELNGDHVNAAKNYEQSTIDFGIASDWYMQFSEHSLNSNADDYNNVMGKIRVDSTIAYERFIQEAKIAGGYQKELAEYAESKAFTDKLVLASDWTGTESDNGLDNNIASQADDRLHFEDTFSPSDDNSIIVVLYEDEQGNELLPAEGYVYKKGEKYSIPVKNIQGYKVLPVKKDEIPATVEKNGMLWFNLGGYTDDGIYVDTTNNVVTGDVDQLGEDGITLVYAKSNDEKSNLTDTQKVALILSTPEASNYVNTTDPSQIKIQKIQNPAGVDLNGTTVYTITSSNDSKLNSLVYINGDQIILVHGNVVKSYADVQ